MRPWAEVTAVDVLETIHVICSQFAVRGQIGRHQLVQIAKLSLKQQATPMACRIAAEKREKHLQKTSGILYEFRSESVKLDYCNSVPGVKDQARTERSW